MGKATFPISQDGVYVLEQIPVIGITRAAGTTVPADASVGYAPGCLFHDLNSTTAQTFLYVNIGTKASANFDPVGVAVAGFVSVSDADTSISAANSGKVHLIANVSADRTFTLPTAASGLTFEFVPDLNAADGHDWIFTTGSDTNFFTGGVVHIDTDADGAGDEVVLVVPDGNSNSKLQVNLPQPGTVVRFICTGTTWNVSGMAVSATAPTFADQ